MMVRSDLSKQAMGSVIFLAGLILSAAVPGRAAWIVNNSATPLAKNAGRVRDIREVLRIKDGTGDVYFREPWLLDAAPDESIFVQDRLALYRFTPDGKFAGNLVKQGQGPGEVASEITDFVALDGKVLLLSAAPNKLMTLDYAGRLKRELVFTSRNYWHFLAFHNQKCYLLYPDSLAGSTRAGLRTSVLRLGVVAENGSAGETSCSFSETMAVLTGNGATSYDILTQVNSSPSSGKYLYVVDTPQYLIKQVDLEKVAISGTFSREYRRMKSYKADPRDPRRLPGFDNDVYRLLVYHDRVWAVTSTFDPKKGILVDEFGADGKYLDNFWLPLMNSRTGDCFYQRYFALVIRGDYLYAIEHDADWNYSIAKYKL